MDRLQIVSPYRAHQPSLPVQSDGHGPGGLRHVSDRSQSTGVVKCGHRVHGEPHSTAWTLGTGMWNKNRYCYTVVSWGLQELNSYEFQAPFATVQNDFTLMAWCWTVVAPLLMYWSCCSLALPGLRLDVHCALCRSCKNYAYH